MTATIFGTVKNLPLEIIGHNPFQMRDSEDPEHIATLAASIARDGLLQIPLARPGKTGDRVQLAFGHSRLAAYKLLKDRAEKGEIVAGGDLTDLAKYNEMPLMVRELTDEQMFVYGAQENIARKQLTPVEEGKLMLIYRDQFKKTSSQIGELFGLSESTVRNKMRLVDLPQAAIAGLAEGKITEGAARRLLSIQGVVKPEVVAAVATHLIENPYHYTSPDQVDGSIAYQILQQKEAIKLYSAYEAQSGLAKNTFSIEWTPADALPEPTAGQKKRFYSSDVQPVGDELAHPPACKKCPFFVSIANEGICGRKVCFERKKTAWIAMEVARVSAETGIAIYDPETDGKVFEQLDYNNSEMFGKLWESKSPHLRLNDSAGYYAPRLTKSSLVGVISVSPESIKRMRADKQERTDYAAKERAESADRAMREENQKKVGELVKALSPAFGAFIYGHHKIGALKVFARLENANPDLLASSAVGDLLEYLGYQFLRSALPWNLRSEGLEAASAYLAGLATEMGMQLDIDLAAMIAEIENAPKPEEVPAT